MKSVNDVSAHLLTMSPVRAVPRSRRKRQRHRRPMALFRGGKLLIAFRGAEGPDALQVIGDPLTTPLAGDLEGCGPLFRPETWFTPVRGHRLHIGRARKGR